MRPPSLLSLPSPPLPSLLRRRGSNTTNYSFFFNKGREGGSCCQQLRGGRLRLLCRLSKRLVEKLASSKPRASSGAAPTPTSLALASRDRLRLLRPEGGDREARPDAQGVEEASTREDAKSRDARGTSPPAAGPVCGIPPGSEAPYGRNPVPSSATPAPSRQLGWGSGRGSLALLSPKPNFRQQSSQSVLQGKGEAEAPREKPHPRGTRGGDSPPSAGPGFSGWGSEEPHGLPRATAVPGAGAAHNPWSAPTGKPARVSPVCRAARAPVPSPAPARAQAAAGAPLSRRRALGPQLVICGFSAPPQRAYSHSLAEPPATFTCADLA